MAVPALVLPLALLVSMTVFTDAASATTFNVTKTADTNDGACNTDCSLREAVIAANAAPGQDTINVPAGTYVLTLIGREEDFAATGDLDIRDDVVIVGAPYLGTTIRGDLTATLDLDRIFEVFAPAQVQMELLVMVDGREYGGGGLLVRGGSAYLQDCELVNNAAVVGGAIAVLSGAHLELFQVTVRSNTAQTDGGGIYDLGDDLVIDGSLIQDNDALNGDGGGVWTAGDGSSGLRVTRSRFRYNRANDGGGVLLDLGVGVVTDTEFTGNRQGQLESSGALTVADSRLVDADLYEYSTWKGALNVTGGTALVTKTDISGNGYALNSGIYVSNANVVVAESLIADNRNGSDAFCLCEPPSCPTPYPIVDCSSTVRVETGGTLTLSNSTISGNGDPLADTLFPVQTLGVITTYGGLVNMLNCTVTDNHAIVAIDASSGSITFANTMIARNPDAYADCGSGSLVSNGGNIDGDGSCNLTHPTDQPNVDPLLGLLQDNGGQTATHALLAGSPAINAGNPASCPATDQRGISRALGGTCDIGAYEVVCGDGNRAGSEACDDGNTAAGDGCSPTCSCEPGVGPDSDADGLSDLCDPCPADPTNTCNANQSGSGVVDSSGGTVSTPGGELTIEVPPGALDSPVTISITEDVHGFNLMDGSRVVYRVALRPEGQTFNKPVTVTVRWKDEDDDGNVDRGLCDDGTTPCDSDDTCTTACTGEGTVPMQEINLVLRRNGARFSMNNCSDHDITNSAVNGCDTATAGDVGGNCVDPSVSAAKCCDMAGESWGFETCGFSEIYIGDTATPLIPGKGSPKSDCVAEWSVDNPWNDPLLDRRLLPNFQQTCTDGDLLCDADDAADGKCTFEIGVCLNLDDATLQKDGVPQCAASDVEIWEIKKPRPDDKKPQRAANGKALREAVQTLGAHSVGGTHGGEVVFSPALTASDLCTDLVEVVVPLKNGTRKGKETFKTKTTTSPPSGSIKDADTLKLTCLPAP